jgi:uncharacterized membrane protein
MNRHQKLAIVILKCFAVMLVFLGFLFMSQRSFRYPTYNPSNFEAALFVSFLVLVHALPGILLFVFSGLLGRFIGKNLGD